MKAIALAALLAASPQLSLPQTATTGPETWVGGIDLGGDWMAVTLTIAANDSQATLDFPTIRAAAYHNIQLRNFRRRAGRIHFEWTDEDGAASIDGLQNRDRISATFRQGATSARATLVPGTFPDTATVRLLSGLYELEPGHLLWLGPVSELSRQFGFVDAKTGRAGVLYQEQGGRLFSGKTSMIPFPIGVRATYSPAIVGDPGLNWIDASGRRSRARKLASYRTEEVSFQNDSIRLSGTLLIPVKSGRHPAVVFIHGAAAQVRTYFSSLPYLLANSGIAALVYDKRGVGKSSGNRHASTMADFADDALAGVRLLQSRPDIDAGKIGLFGHSQGGWQAPLAAVRSNGGVAFVVTAAGPAKDYRSQTNDEIANMIRFAGLGRDAAAAAIAHQDLYWGVMRHQVAWALLAASSDSARTKPWGRFVWKPRAEADVLGDTLEYIDPEPVLTRLTQAILAMYGAHDIRVNGTENARLMRAFLARAGNRSAEVRTFDNADHDFWIARKKTIKDVSGTTGYVSRYLSTVVEWIRAQAAKP